MTPSPLVRLRRRVRLQRPLAVAAHEYVRLRSRVMRRRFPVPFLRVIQPGNGALWPFSLFQPSVLRAALLWAARAHPRAIAAARTFLISASASVRAHSEIVLQVVITSSISRMLVLLKRLATFRLQAKAPFRFSRRASVPSVACGGVLRIF